MRYPDESSDDESLSSLPGDGRVVPQNSTAIYRRRIIEESESESESERGVEEDVSDDEDAAASIDDLAATRDQAMDQEPAPRGGESPIELHFGSLSITNAGKGQEPNAAGSRSSGSCSSVEKGGESTCEQSFVGSTIASDDKSPSSSPGDEEGDTSGTLPHEPVVPQKSTATYRRRIIEESDSDSESEGGVDEEVSDEEDAAASIDDSTATRDEEPAPRGGKVQESPILLDVGSLSITNAGKGQEPNAAGSISPDSCSSVEKSGESNFAAEQSIVGSAIDSPSNYEKEEEGIKASSMAKSPPASTEKLKDNDSADLRDSAWTLDETSDEYFLTGQVDAIKGEVRWPKLRVPRKLYDRLYDHQKVGVQWMASMHTDGVGGILGDDMGLGKTYQTLTYLGGLMRARMIRSALVVCPLSLLRTWEKEARDILVEGCELDATINVISSDVPKIRRCDLLKTAMTCSTGYPHLTITTYGLVTSNPLDFVRNERGDEEMAWNYVVLDEGHKIKNPATKAAKSCHRICKNEKTRRLLLTGTPIQNNLKEMWALFDWATSSRLLGKLPNFKNRFSQPIEAGRHKNASDSTIAIAKKANTELQELLRPHFLQRLKSVEFKDELPTKRELVVWTHLSNRQRQMYEDYVENGGNVQSILAGEISSPLEAITWLKKLCGHPLLVSWKKDDWNLLQFGEVDPKVLVRDSAKLKVLVDLLTRLQNSGHRTLVFSQSTKMLDIIENVLCHLSLARIDGSTKERERQRIVNSFNKQGSRHDVLLLSTKAGGLGLTLTGADRCVIYDPSWNPAEDSQAVDRCFRIGQSKRVTVYRFIAAGTVEERMYEKQVFKDGIRRAIMTSKGSSTERYFDSDELRRLFQLAPEGVCEILEKFSGRKARSDTYDEEENEKENTPFVVGASGKPSFLDSHRHVVGLSSHDHLYTSALADSSASTFCEEAPSTPFSGTPLKERRLGRAGRAMLGKKLDFGSSAGPEYRKPEFRKVAHTDKGSHVERKPLAVVVDTEENTPTSIGLSRSYLKSDERKQSRLRTPPSGDGDGDELEKAMGQMLDRLDRDMVSGQEKVTLHQNIARLAVQLGWL